MGISNFTWHIIKGIESSGDSLGDVLTIGVQKDYRIFKNNKNYLSSMTNIIKSLGTTNNVDTLDVSNYQGANIIANLSEPLNKKIKQYNTVIDCGVIEHVFNIKQCIYNYISLVSKGGNLIVDTPCNNFTGHGFYQFSPEFFFNVLSFNNLFKEINCYLIKYPIGGASVHPKAWIVPDPKQTGNRVMFKNSDPIGILTIAKRSNLPLCSYEDFDIIQSDYVTEHKKIQRSDNKVSLRRKLFKKLPPFVQFLYSNFRLNQIHNLNNNSIFKPYKWEINND